MPTLLAVETSGALCSLAIHVAGRWFEDTHIVERLHNRVVLQRLDALVASAGVDRRAFEAVAFGAGPGSFTGVRIAAAVAQAMAFASDAVVVPVRSAAAVAAAVATGGGHVGRLITVTRSRRDAYYLAGFTLAGARPPIATSGDRLHQGTAVPAELADAGAGCLGAGNRPPWWPESLPFQDAVRVTAAIVGELALAMLERGEGVSAEAGLPLYVSGDSPWRPASG